MNGKPLIRRTSVFCTTQFIGWHRWPEAPEELSYLSLCHRHVFKVRVDVAVVDLNREIEFISLKKLVDNYINFVMNTSTKDDPVNTSCEMFAERIAYAVFERYNIDRISVEVSEDGENGATFCLIKDTV